MKPPAWVRALDAAALVAVALGLVAIAIGGVVLTAGPVRLPLHSPAQILFVAAALAAVRHAAHPSPPIHRRVFAWLDAARPGWPAIAGAALISRVAVLVVAYAAVLTVGLAAANAGFEVSSDPLTNLPARFDAGWYVGIAHDGYDFQARFDRQQNVAFFPAFPMLMRGAGWVVGGFERGLGRPWRFARLLWAGVLISLAAFAWASVYFIRLARDTIGEERAQLALALMAAYPFAVFFSAPYTESLFLLGAVGAFYHFRREEWSAAAAWGLLAGLTRPNGCFLAIALAVMAVEQRRALPRAFASAAASVVGMLAFSAYVRAVTGSWFGWARLHETWGRTFAGFGPLWQDLTAVGSRGVLHAISSAPFGALNTAGLLFALALVWPAARRLGPAWAVFILINVVPPLLAGGVLSMGRISSTLFPAFLALAVVLPRRAALATITAFALGQGLVAALFFTWRPIF